MNREVHVRFWERLGVKVPWATRQSLAGAIKYYAGVSGRLSVTKFVLSNHPNPAPYLNDEGKYLKADHSVRHYHYKDVDKLKITELENVCSQQIG